MELEEIINGCKRGERQAQGLLYKRYSRQMLGVCHRLVQDKQIAQDLMHDGFILIFASIHALQRPEKLESWMRRIMTNLALRYINQTRLVPIISIEDLPKEQEPIDEETLFEPIPLDTLLEAIEKLPEGYRNVFKLSVFDGLSHKEIADVLHIAPHSSSSQLSRAKILLKKVFAAYRVYLVLLLLFLFPALCDNWKKKGTKEYLSDIADRQIKTTEMQDHKSGISARRAPHYIGENSPIAYSIPSVSLDTILTTNSSVSEVRDTINKESIISSSSSLSGTFFSSKKKATGKWKLMLAGSLGPQLAQNLYKLIATPHSGGVTSGLPEQVSTWEEYYTYLNTRYQAGTLGDSLGLLNVAKNNSGRIIEHQQHDSPVTIGLSFSKTLNGRWSLETGLQYTYLKSVFTTGEEYKIQDTQKIHYLGIPLRFSYRLWNYKRFSVYSAAGIQLDIPLKGTLNSAHTTDSIPMNLGRQSLDVPLQWSINAGAGVQYHVTPHISFYLEPTVNYYIPDGSGLRTVRKEHPFTFTVPLGVRFSY